MVSFTLSKPRPSCGKEIMPFSPLALPFYTFLRRFALELASLPLLELGWAFAWRGGPLAGSWRSQGCVVVTHFEVLWWLTFPCPTPRTARKEFHGVISIVTCVAEWSGGPGLQHLRIASIPPNTYPHVQMENLMQDDKVLSLSCISISLPFIFQKSFAISLIQIMTLCSIVSPKCMATECTLWFSKHNPSNTHTHFKVNVLSVNIFFFSPFLWYQLGKKILERFGELPNSLKH